MDFGDAIRALKAGKRVSRAGWNGKGMWLALTEGSTVLGVYRKSPELPHSLNENLRGAARTLALTEEPAEVRIGAHIDMRAADGSLVIGWLASQTDMLSDDWEVIE